MRKELEEMARKQFEGLSAYEISYSLRVRHFLFLDVVLSSEMGVAGDELVEALNYLKVFLSFITFYLTIFPSYFGDVIDIRLLRVCEKLQQQ
jgi:ubiquitin carboxyl-terminal hydrolase 9/24